MNCIYEIRNGEIKFFFRLLCILFFSITKLLENHLSNSYIKIANTFNTCAMQLSQSKYDNPF